MPDMGKGTYVLILFLERDKDMTVGREGRSSRIPFRAGYYAYVGSGHGPGGLRSRIHHHLIKDKKCVWHMLYVIRNSRYHEHL